MLVHGILDRITALTFFVAFGCLAACRAWGTGSVYVMFTRCDLVGTTSLIAAVGTAGNDAFADPI